MKAFICITMLATLIQVTATNITRIPPKDQNLRRGPDQIGPSISDSRLVNALVRALRRIKSVEIRKVITLEYNEEPEDEPEADVMDGIAEGMTSFSPSTGPRTRLRPGLQLRLKPDTGDAGVCSTVIQEDYTMTDGILYFDKGRRVSFTRPIYPKLIKCRHELPSSGDGKCKVVGYPHGAWIRVSHKDLSDRRWKHCSQDEQSKNYWQCWDYVNVPGCCVLSKDS